MLDFDPIAHEYTAHGRRVPSVTQVMDGTVTSFAGIPPAVLEYKSALGQAVHRACDLDDRKDLDELSIDQVIVPYLSAWRKFIAETGFVYYYSEQAVHSIKYGYAGTLDRFGEIKSVATLIDLKTVTVLSPATGIQLAGYEQAARETFDHKSKKINRYAVQLKPDGTYRMEQYKDPNDFAVFLACLQIHSFKVKHGYKS